MVSIAFTWLLVCIFIASIYGTTRYIDEEFITVTEYISTKSLNDIYDRFMRTENNTLRKGLNVAVLTAGQIRSFFYVQKSWEKYLLYSANANDNIHLFAHVVSTPKNNCPINTKGINSIVRLSTENEISYSSAIFPFEHSNRTTANSCGHKKMQKSNILDMYARRHRVYSMAMSYATGHEMDWDLILFVRTDAAIYGKPQDYHKWYHLLHQYTTETGREGLYIPGRCGFGWLCDRMALGLPLTMGTYFRASPSQVNTWWDSQTEIDVTRVPPSGECKSERIMALWLYLHNITHIEFDEQISFATLRVECGRKYCKLNRPTFLKLGCLFWTDATMFTVGKRVTAVVTDDDMVSDIAFRCGDSSLFSSSVWKMKSCDMKGEKKWRGEV